MASRQSTLSSFFNVSNVRTAQSSEKKTSYEIKRKRCWVESCGNAFPGLRDSENGLICGTCERHRNLAGSSSFLTGCISYRITTIQAHFATASHIRCRETDMVAERQHEGNVPGPMDAVLNRLSDEEAALLKQKFNTAYFVMHHEMPWTVYPNLLKLQVKNGSNINFLKSYQSDKACSRFGGYIAQAVREPIQAALQEAKSISVMFDGATDCSVSEVEIIYCRLVKDGVPREYFVGLQELEHAHSNGVFSAINEAMIKFGCHDWLDKLVGAGSDGASVNIGRNNSVKTRMMEGRQHVVFTHCVAHRLELGVLSGIKDHPMLVTVQEMLYQMHKHYHYSPKALRELKTIAETMEDRFIKPQRLQGTRWLPHVMKASDALMKGYSAIRTHFEHVSQAGPNQATDAVKGRAKHLATKLQDWRVLRFMAFLQDLLQVVAQLSLTFQTSSITALEYLDAMEMANLMLVQLQAEPGEKFLEFTSHIHQNQDGCWQFKGQPIKHFDPDRLYDFRNVAESVMDKMNARFGHQDPVIQAARVFDCKDWPRDRQALALYGNAEITQLVAHFSHVLVRRGCDVAMIPQEWTSIKASLSRRFRNAAVLPTIQEVLHSAGPDNIAHLIEVILTLPMSSAVCERGFSAVKRIKSDCRACLNTETLDNLLCVSLEGPSLERFNATRAAHLWWTRGQRQRRPNFGNESDTDDDDL
ncbi:zinc finger protein 862-like [Mya arenaria]|uniref:zinc finger protein 862-like n=1 Tax=Mya arenaria TaxID=6604 RepID=UPI0022E35239|nr:zinc finger protein 862-like [Mya arenaria]